MISTKTYSRDELQLLQKKELLSNYLNEYCSTSVSYLIIESARQGKTQYFWSLYSDKGILTVPSILTKEELVSALKEKFPETTVEYQETLVEVGPGMMEQKKGILIDWS